VVKFLVRSDHLTGGVYDPKSSRTLNQATPSKVAVWFQCRLGITQGIKFKRVRPWSNGRPTSSTGRELIVNAWAISSENLHLAHKFMPGGCASFGLL